MKSDAAIKLPLTVRKSIGLFLPSERRSQETLRRLRADSMTMADFHSHLATQLCSGAPLVVGRPGGTESEGVRQLLAQRFAHKRYGLSQHYSSWLRKNGPLLSGLIHASEPELDAVLFTYLSSIWKSEVLVYGTFASGVLPIIARKQAMGTPIAEIHNFEPLLAFQNSIPPWTLALEGQRVLVVHPFATSIERQFKRKHAVKSVREILPSFDLITLRPPDFLDGNHSRVSWHAALDALVARVRAIDFDVALIGAGGFGLPLAVEIGKLKRKAIHVGGSLQLLFGIVGRRWESMPEFKPLMGENWVRPRADEKPANAHLRENAVYW